MTKGKGLKCQQIPRSRLLDRFLSVDTAAAIRIIYLECMLQLAQMNPDR